MRGVVIALGALLLCGPLLAGLRGVSLAGPLLLGAMILVGTLAERWRYRRLLDTPPTGPGWVVTHERFTDLESGATVTVYANARDGARRYVREAAR